MLQKWIPLDWQRTMGINDTEEAEEESGREEKKCCHFRYKL
jgi:hypothetical protein